MVREESKMSQVIALMKDIRRLRKRIDELDAQLIRSLALVELFGTGIFQSGNVKCYTTGDPNKELIFTCKTADGDEYSLDLIAVPVELWSASVIEDIRKRRCSFRNKYRMKYIEHVSQQEKGD